MRPASTTTPERKTFAMTFVERLSKLDRGDLAILKRNAGTTLAESRGAMKIFYQMYPSRDRDRDEEIFFLIATLYGLNPHSGHGNFGRTMRSIRDAGGSPDAMDRRMGILLDSEFDLVDGYRAGGGELSYRLRQCVKLAGSRQIGIDWPQLLEDLRWWGHPSKRSSARNGLAPISAGLMPTIPNLLGNHFSCIRNQTQKETVTMLVEIHMLQNHAPSNLNRDDTGSPKECTFGGIKRGRISSQCLKRSIRRSPVFRDALSGEDQPLAYADSQVAGISQEASGGFGTCRCRSRRRRRPQGNGFRHEREKGKEARRRCGESRRRRRSSRTSPPKISTPPRPCS